jgi:hypothetical protein
MITGRVFLPAIPITKSGNAGPSSCHSKENGTGTHSVRSEDNRKRAPRKASSRIPTCEAAVNFARPILRRTALSRVDIAIPVFVYPSHVGHLGGVAIEAEPDSDP